MSVNKNWGNQIIREICETPNGLLAVAAGEIDGVFSVSKFGKAPAVGASEVTIWDKSIPYPWQTSAGTVTVSSDNPADSLSGTGATAVFCEGLDADYNSQGEFFFMDGTNPVAGELGASFLRIFRAYVIMAGSTGKAQGTISYKVDGVDRALILGGNNQSQMAVYTIPSGKEGYLLFGKSSASNGKSVDGRFFTAEKSRPFRLAHSFQLFENSYDFPFDVPIRLPTKMDIEARAISSAVGTTVNAAFNLLVVDKNVLF